MGGLSHTVSGNVASFRTPSRVPIESLKFHFLPKQEGSGDPSPSNVRPITGRTGLNGARGKKNLIKPYFTEVTTVRGLTITPITKGVRVQGKASAEHSIRLSSQDIRFLDFGKKYTFSLYINGDISGCKNPYLGYHDGSVYRSIQTLTQENNYIYTWTVPDKYSNAVAPWFDMYIRVLEGSTVDFEIGLQMEAGENATSYEPYSEELIPITFPTNGKNLVDQSAYTFPDNTAVEIVDGVFKNKLTDTRSNLQLQVQLYDTPTHIVSAQTAINVFSTGRSSLTFSVNFAGCSYLVLKHNGIKKDFKIMFPFNYGIGTYTISVDVLSADPTMVGGVQLKNIQVELGDTATTYEPYSSDNTFYGGYIDPVAGEIVAEYTYKVCDGSEQWSSSSASESNKIFHTTPAWLGLPDPINSSTAFAKFSYFKSYAGLASWNGFIGSTGNILFYVPSATASTVTKWKAYLSEHNLQICYKLAEPINIPIAPQAMKAFLDHNNFWSDANDITEVTYAVVESKDMFDARKRIMSKTWNMLPLLYTEVEYISAKDSNPYIDMGIKFTGELEAEVHYYNDKDEAFLFGARKGASSTPYCNFNIESASSDRSRFDYGNQKAVATSGLPFAGYHDGEYIFRFHNRTATMEKVSTGEVVTKDYSSFVRTDYSDYNMLLFSVNTNGTPSLNTGTGELRVYSAKFWIGGQLVRDLVPCFRKSDNKPGMYDRVSKTFFTNAGSGEFSLPA